MRPVLRRAIPDAAPGARPVPRLGAALALAVLLPLSPAEAASAASAIAAGDAAYARHDLQQARRHYSEALGAADKDYGALWRLARVESELGEDATGDAQRELVMKAVEHAREAVQVAPGNAQGHVWLAVALGRQALKEGPKARLALAREIKSEVDRAIAIDRGIGRAYHVRALWNRKIASLSFVERAAANTVLGGVPRGASMDNAVRDLEQAIELEPKYVNHRLELGRTFMEMERWPEARRELETAVSLAPTSNPRDDHYQAEARVLLAKLAKKKR